jgi:hypothetical protein
MVLKRHSDDSWHSTDWIWAASDTRHHMHAGKRPCGPFRCDDATEMQVGGLDALENAAGRPLASTADLAKAPVDEYRKDTARPHTYQPQ